MMRPRLLQRDGATRLAIAVLVVFAGALVLGWGAGDATLPAAPTAAAPPWSMPSPRPDDPSRDLALLTARHPWSAGAASDPAAAAAAAAAAAHPSWRLEGVVVRGRERFALVGAGTAAAAPLAYLRVGDRLPDGGVLVAIASDSATVRDPRLPAQPRVYRLFGEKR
jgi:hypothetical protein